jgi:hypothetical protein
VCWKFNPPALLELPVDINQLYTLISKQACCCPHIRVDCAGIDACHACRRTLHLLTILLLLLVQLSLLLKLQLPLLLRQLLILTGIAQALVGLEACSVHPVVLLLSL